MLDNRVKALRLKKSVTQEDLAERVGVSRQTILAIEKGNYEPSLVLAMRLADFFKQPVEKIFNLK